MISYQTQRRQESQRNINLSMEDQLIIENFKKLQRLLTYTVLSSLLIIGTIGCVFNTIIFLRPYFKSSSCSRYYLAASFANGFQLIFGLTSSILDFGFSLHPHHHSSILCKLRNYSINVAGFLSQTFLLFACIDRYLITTRFRRMSRIFIANGIILSSTCFWLLHLSHMLIYSDISPSKHFCFFSSASYTLFLSLHNLILSGLILPILMIVFGLLTLTNIQRIRRQVRTRNRRNHYLSLMLLTNVAVNVTFTLIYTSGLIYLSFFMSNEAKFSSLKRRLISLIAIIFYYVPYAISFYVNILTSQRFRCEFKTSLHFNRRKMINKNPSPPFPS